VLEASFYKSHFLCFTAFEIKRSHHFDNHAGLRAASVCTSSEAAVTSLTNTDYNSFLYSGTLL